MRGVDDVIGVLRKVAPASDPVDEHSEEWEWLFEEGHGRYVVSRRHPSFSLLDEAPGGQRYGTVAGIDGSSRLLYFSRGIVAIAAVTLFARRGGIHVYYTYPDLPGASSGEAPRLEAAIAAYQPSPTTSPEMAGLVRFRPPAYSWSNLPQLVRDILYRYDSGYNSKMMESELRMLQENAMLSWALSGLGDEGLVMIDGPIFSTPGIFERMDLLGRGERPERVRVYLESWLSIVLDRLRAVQGGVERGVDVVGIVKRLHASRLLVAALEAPAINDLALVQRLAEKWIEGLKPYRPLIIGPIETRLRLETLGLPDAVKYSYYVLVPAHPLVSRPGDFRVFRVELPEKMYNDPERRLRALSGVIREALRGGGLPAPIAAADNVCSRASRALASMVYRALGGEALPGYESLRDAVLEERY